MSEKSVFHSTFFADPASIEVLPLPKDGFHTSKPVKMTYALPLFSSVGSLVFGFVQVVPWC